MSRRVRTVATAPRRAPSFALRAKRTRRSGRARSTTRHAASDASSRSPPSRSQAAATAARAPARRTRSRPACHALALIGRGCAAQRLKLSQRSRLVPIEAQGFRGNARRQYLQRHIANDAENPQGSDHQSRHVIAGDIFCHLSAEGQNFCRVRSAGSRRAHGRAPTRRWRAPDPTIRPPPCPPTVPPGAKRGGSNGRHWPVFLQVPLRDPEAACRPAPSRPARWVRSW